MSKLEKGSKEWREAKAQAKQDLDVRMSLGLPHQAKPINAPIVRVPKAAGEGAAKKTAKKVAKKATPSE